MPESTDRQAPPRAVPGNDTGYLEKITQAVFQAGFSWKVIENKWPNFQKAFADFDIDTVAAFTDVDLERLVEDKGIVRNGRKIAATIHNAQVCQELIREHGSFPAYLRSLDDLDYWTRAKQFIKQFKYLGDMGAYFVLWSVGEDVPEYEEWQEARGKS